MNSRKRGLTDNPLFTKTEQAQPAPLPSPSAEAALVHSEPHPIPAVQQVKPNDAPLTTLPINPPVEPPTGQSTNPSTMQSTDPSTSQPSLALTTRQILNRPASFYLYEDQSEDLDNLVNLLKKEYRLKTDRSALLRAILSEPVLDYHQRETHRTLIDRLIQQSTSRLISQ